MTPSTNTAVHKTHKSNENTGILSSPKISPDGPQPLCWHFPPGSTFTGHKTTAEAEEQLTGFPLLVTKNSRTFQYPRNICPGGYHANDSTLLCPHKSTTTVEEEIAHVMNWAVENKMTVNLLKTVESLSQTKYWSGPVTAPNSQRWPSKCC